MEYLHRFHDIVLPVVLELQNHAKRDTKCKRKGVGLTVWGYDPDPEEGEVGISYYRSFINGFPDSQNTCTNEVGNCGCPHAEVIAVQELLRIYHHDDSPALIFAGNYSPCTNCANAIVLSEIVVGSMWLIDTEHDMRGIDILKHHGIQTLKMHEEILK